METQTLTRNKILISSLITPPVIEKYGVGIDIGKDINVATFKSMFNKEGSPLTFSNDKKGFARLVKYLNKNNVPLSATILTESTGTYHRAVADHLTALGYSVRIVNPIVTKKITNKSIRRTKTDEQDCARLATLALQNEGYPHDTNIETRKLKGMTRHYWLLSHLEREARAGENYLVDNYRVRKLKSSELLTKQLDDLKEQIIDQFKDKRLIDRLDTIPGISPFLAVCILAELAPWTKFNNVGQVVAYAGLDPKIKQSGGKKATYGSLSKRGSETLREVVYMAAMGAFRTKEFKPMYDHFKSREFSHRQTLCIIARKILVLSFTLLKKKQDFKPEFAELWKRN